MHPINTPIDARHEREFTYRGARVRVGVYGNNFDGRDVFVRVRWAEIAAAGVPDTEAIAFLDRCEGRVLRLAAEITGKPTTRGWKLVADNANDPEAYELRYRMH